MDDESIAETLEGGAVELSLCALGEVTVFVEFAFASPDVEFALVSVDVEFVVVLVDVAFVGAEVSPAVEFETGSELVEEPEV